MKIKFCKHFKLLLTNSILSYVLESKYACKLDSLNMSAYAVHIPNRVLCMKGALFPPIVIMYPTIGLDTPTCIVSLYFQRLQICAGYDAQFIHN